MMVVCGSGPGQLAGLSEEDKPSEQLLLSIVRMGSLHCLPQASSADHQVCSGSYSRLLTR